MKKILAGLALAVAAAACGGDSGGSSGLNGSVQGVSMNNAKETASAVISASCPDGQGGTASGKIVVVVTSDQSGICAAAQAGAGKKNASGLLITVGKFAQGSSVPDVAPGTYTIGQTADQTTGVVTFAAAAVSKTDNACSDVVSQDATSGTVTIASISGNAVSGTVNLKFGNDSVTGSFSGAACALPSSVTQDFCSGGGTTNSCQ